MNLKKQVTTHQGKAQSEKRSLTDWRIAGEISDFFKLRDAKWREVLPEVINRLTDNVLERLYRMQDEKKWTN